MEDSSDAIWGFTLHIMIPIRKRPKFRFGSVRFGVRLFLASSVRFGSAKNLPNFCRTFLALNRWNTIKICFFWQPRSVYWKEHCYFHWEEHLFKAKIWNEIYFNDTYTQLLSTNFEWPNYSAQIFMDGPGSVRFGSVRFGSASKKFRFGSVRVWWKFLVRSFFL